MLIEGKVHRVLEFKDLNSLVSLSLWLKENLTIYPEDKKIPSGNMIKHLRYIKEQARDQGVEDKRKWFDKIDKLMERASDA